MPVFANVDVVYACMSGKRVCVVCVHETAREEWSIEFKEMRAAGAFIAGAVCDDENLHI